METVRPTRRRLAIGLVAAAAAGAALLWHADPFRPGLLPPCPFFALTGLYCPGCGTTRALHALLHADLPLALAMNPLLIVCLPLVAWMIADLAGWRPQRLERWRARITDARPWAIVVVTYMVLRNLPWQPFVWLAPGGYVY